MRSVFFPSQHIMRRPLVGRVSVGGKRLKKWLLEEERKSGSVGSVGLKCVNRFVCLGFLFGNTGM